MKKIILAIAGMLFVTMMLFARLLELAMQESDNVNVLHLGIITGIFYGIVADIVFKKIDREVNDNE